MIIDDQIDLEAVDSSPLDKSKEYFLNGLVNCDHLISLVLFRHPSFSISSW